MRIFKLFLLCIITLHCSEAENKIQNSDSLKDVKKKNVEQFKLPNKLNEVSGLCLTDDERLFAHNDEKGAVHQIDLKTGQIIKSFFLGKVLTVNQDFEGIAYADENFYLISSDGLLYKFNEGNDGEAVEYETIDLKLNSKFDIEGLCYDGQTESLLIASKEYPGKGYNGYRAVYSIPINSLKVDVKPRFLISLKELEQKYGIKDFYPSAIETANDGKSFYILSSKGHPCLVKIDTNGKVINAVRLNEKLHLQPEGLTFLKDGTVVISDEAAGKIPTITFYKKNPFDES